MAMSANCTPLPVLSLFAADQVAPWSVEREKYIAFPPFPVKRDHAKYTVPSQRPPVRSASSAVLSLNLPPRFGADEPVSTIVLPTKRFPSFRVLPLSPPGLSNVATHT